MEKRVRFRFPEVIARFRKPESGTAEYRPSDTAPAEAVDFGEEENMNRGVMWIGVMLVSVLMLLPLASAATVFGASAKGATDAATCVAAGHFLIVPIALGVSNGDTVEIWWNTTHYDNRSAGSRTATHSFSVVATHNGVTVGTWGNYTSTGGLPGGGVTNNLLRTVSITDDTKTIAITWSASVTITPGCSASTSLNHTIQLS